MGRKCGVETCLSDSARTEDTGVTFHKVPMHPDIRPKWMSLCRIPEDKKDVKVIYICSRHFLRADFCNFKGKKYMLKQGVLPSVFPWTKLKVESPEDVKPVIPEITGSENIPQNNLNSIKLEFDGSYMVKEEPKMDLNEKSSANSPQSATIEQKVKTVQTAFGILNFAINSRIEALDFNNEWFPAKIVEIDYEENEVLVHFEKYSNKYDEWICMDSARLRPLQTNAVKKMVPRLTFNVGERCMASWSDARKFAATVTKIVDEDTYEVLFDDGFVKVLKSHRMAKKNVQSSPLFDPVQGSKQDRRDKKRKINVAELFGKRARTEYSEEKSVKSPQLSEMTSYDEIQPWMPRWENGYPVGVESTIEMNDGERKSVIVSDPRLPPGWMKHLAQRTQGALAGKWEVFIISSEGRKFKTRAEIKAFLEEHPSSKYHMGMFDFGLYRRFARRSNKFESASKVTSKDSSFTEPAAGSSTEEEMENANSLKIELVDGSYKCPIEGCGKIFRKENLAQMHVKHYHPEYTKFLDFTPNVADLAYARTVGEALDRSPGPPKPPQNKLPTKLSVSKTSTPKAQSPLVDEQKPPIPNSLPPKAKDSEIIKLLNSKPFDGIKSDDISPLPPGLPSNMYPDIKLKDLLNKSEGIPKRDDLNLKTLSASTTRPTGIKTLLPVRQSENKIKNLLPDSEKMQFTPKPTFTKQSLKRKRFVSEIAEPKPVEIKQELVSQVQEVVQPPPHQNVIIEGGEVIKIVQMKREEIINCTCGITEEDGLMIQCELCLCWQHAYCNNIERENQVPEKYICYICQNPARQRVSRKYFHDQDWLKVGTLATANYHSKDEELLAKRFEKLKKSHDISGGLLELKDFVHSLKVKIKIAETKNHPKLYQWSKPWEKLPLPEKIEEPQIKIEPEVKPEPQDSMLFSILKSGKEEQKLKMEFDNFPKLDINTFMDQLPPAPLVPQPEAAINSADCKVNLVEHIAHSQSLVEERLDDFEAQLNELDVAMKSDDDDENYPRVRQTLQMLLRDLNTLKEFSNVSAL